MSTLVLYGATMRRTVIEFRRYAFDSVSGIVMIYGFFLLIFFGAKVFGSGRPGFGHTLAAVVVSFALWSFTVLALERLTFEVMQDAQLGTLEQVAMSPFGMWRVLLARITTALSVNFVITSLLLVLMMATTGKWLNVAPLSTLPILVLTIAGVAGLGFVLGGVAIVFKRIQQALQIWQLAIFGLIVAPIERVPFLKYLPIAWGSYLLRGVMVDHRSLATIPFSSTLFLIVNSLAYLVIGIAIFRRLELVARERGLLGHY